MRRNGRALYQSAFLLLLLGSTWNTRSFGGTVNDMFAGFITGPTAGTTMPKGVVVGDFVVGNILYPSTQPAKSLGNYDFSGGVPNTYTLAFKIYTSTAMTTQVFADGFTGNTMAGTGNYFDALLVFHAAGAYPNGTTIDITGDSTYKLALGQTFATTGIPAFDLTLYNPTNSFGSTKGVYTSKNLPLPDQTTLLSDFAATVSTPGHLAWDPTGLSFNADIDFLWATGTPPPNFGSVPEPSSFISGLIAVAICTASIGVVRCKNCAA
jgi:hypothetical protein